MLHLISKKNISRTNALAGGQWHVYARKLGESTCESEDTGTSLFGKRLAKVEEQLRMKIVGSSALDAKEGAEPKWPFPIKPHTSSRAAVRGYDSSIVLISLPEVCD